MDGINSYFSGNVSNESSISDDDISIPSDTLLMKNTVITNNKLPSLLEIKSSPFNKFSLTNLHNY